VRVPSLIRPVEVTMTLDVVERTLTYRPARDNRSQWKVTGGADFTTKPVQLIGMGKGSGIVRDVAVKGGIAV